MRFFQLIAVLLASLFVTLPALAADWTVTRVRGTVEQLIDNVWVPLKRGDVIENDRYVRTKSDGHAEVQRNLEVLTLGVNTTIRIQQDEQSGFTTVLQDIGRLEVEAEVKNVKHFAVQTPFLAAVVKGTHFVVTATLDGTTVAVDRGKVGVTAVKSERTTTIGIGQTATVQRRADLAVGGLGPWPTVYEKGAEIPDQQVAALGGTMAAGGGTMAAGAGTDLELRGGLAGGSEGAQGAGLSGLPESGGGPGQQVAAAPLVFGGAGGGAMVGDAPMAAAAAEAEPVQPVSFSVVMIGALIGAALGALALFFRRAIH